MKYQKLLSYIIIFVLAIIVTKISSDFGRIHTDVDSARYMISALIQSEAAILAIVITLSLIAIQQSSSSYSTRVIDIFTKSPDFLILILTYMSTIIFGSWVLKQIPHSNYNLSLELYIWIVYLLSIFALLALCLYIVNTLEMLKPTKIIKILSKDINFTKINKAINLENNNNIDENGQIQPINDRIQPIVDVLQGSMMKYDYETTRYGLKIIEKNIYDILKDKKYDGNRKPMIASRFIIHVETIGIVAAKQQMNKIVEQVASILGKFGTFMITDDINYISSDSILSLKKIGKIAAKQEMEDVTDTIISSFEDIAKTAIDNKLEDDTRKVMTSIREIGLSNVTSAHISYSVIYSVSISLENIIKKVAEKWGKEWEKDIWHGIFALQYIGYKLTEYKNVVNTDRLSLENKIMGAIFSISEITIDLELKRATYYAYMSVKDIGMRAADDNIDIANEARFILKDIHRNAIKKYPGVENESSIKFLHQIKDNIQELDDCIKSKQRNAPPEYN